MSTNEELLNSAMSEEPVEQVETGSVETAEQESAGRLRDEQGRFAARQEQQADEQPQKEREGFVPSGRLREEREAREAAERRATEIENYWRTQAAQWQQRAPQQVEPAKPQIDPVERVLQDPNGFVQEAMKSGLDPIVSQLTATREFYSQRDAVREHGQEKVEAAYKWIAEGVQTRDPARMQIYQRAMSSMDPYGEIVGEHQKSSVYSQIGNDPAAWFQKQLDAMLADPKFAGEMMQKIQGTLQPEPQERSTFTVPPSLRRHPGARPGSESSGDMSNAALMQDALR